MNQPNSASLNPLLVGGATFQVVLNGLHPTVSAPEAKAKLAALFKATPGQVETLLAQHGYVVKKGCSHEVATKYKNAIEGAGAACSVIAEDAAIVPLDVELPAPAPVVSQSGQAGQLSSPPPVQALSPAPQVASMFQLRPGETVMFEGDLTRVNSKLSVSQGDGLVTNERFVFQAGSDVFTVEKTELVGLEEEKHGFAKKFVLQRQDGAKVEVLAANMLGLKNALFALAGRPFDDAALAQPALSSAKNTTAWLAAFGPIIANVLEYLILGSSEDWRFISVIKVELVKLALIYMLIRIDHLKLQQQGFNTASLGIKPPEMFPIYLNSRAKAFGHGKGYSITWMMTFGLYVLGVLMAVVGGLSS